MYKKILVPLDGSQISQCVLPQVRSIALGLKVPDVIILRVVEPLPDDVRNALVELGGEQIPQVEAKQKDEAAKYVSSTAKDLREAGLHVKGEVLFGNPPEEIINYAKKNNVDLIIMSTHGRSGGSLWLTGSVAERVANHSPVPVQLVSPKECVVRGGL